MVGRIIAAILTGVFAIAGLLLAIESDDGWFYRLLAAIAGLGWLAMMLLIILV